MQQILVIANQTAIGTHLTQKLHELRGQSPTIGVHIVVPATPRAPGGTPVDSEGRTIHDADGKLRAERQLQGAIADIEKTGATVTGSVSGPDPMQGADAAIQQRRVDRIVVSTLPIGASRWIAMDLPHRLSRRFKVPVDHVIGAEIAESAERSPLSGPVHVLLVEDQPADAALTRQALEQTNNDVEMTVAKNGAEALAALRTYGPDANNLVLLDLKMPVLDGHEFLEQASSEFDLDQMNIVVLTTSTNDADRERAHALGASAYIVKDPDFDIFTETLGSVVREVASGKRT